VGHQCILGEILYKPKQDKIGLNKIDTSIILFIILSSSSIFMNLTAKNDSSNSDLIDATATTEMEMGDTQIVTIQQNTASGCGYMRPSQLLGRKTRIDEIRPADPNFIPGVFNRDGQRSAGRTEGFSPALSVVMKSAHHASAVFNKSLMAIVHDPFEGLEVYDATIKTTRIAGKFDPLTYGDRSKTFQENLRRHNDRREAKS
jgi:hypothetical protein